MTTRQMYEGVLTMLQKVGSPSFLLEDFNFIANKAIYLWINKLYTYFEINLQLSDNLGVLKVSVTLLPDKNKAILPKDYFHLLKCICEYNIENNTKCTNSKSKRYKATRLTSDLEASILNDYYTKPTCDNPYYSLFSALVEEEIVKTKKVKLKNSSTKTSEKVVSNRTGIEIIDDGKEPLLSVIVDYIRIPKPINLTLALLNLIEDTSELLEHPDYVCQEIINEIVTLIMADISDPRVLLYSSVTQSIANPVLTQQTNK